VIRIKKLRKVSKANNAVKTGTIYFSFPLYQTPLKTNHQPIIKYKNINIKDKNTTNILSYTYHTVISTLPLHTAGQQIPDQPPFTNTVSIIPNPS
jgi:hypothetical protein